MAECAFYAGVAAQYLDDNASAKVFYGRALAAIEKRLAAKPEEESDLADLAGELRAKVAETDDPMGRATAHRQGNLIASISTSFSKPTGAGAFGAASAAAAGGAVNDLSSLVRKRKKAKQAKRVTPTLVSAPAPAAAADATAAAAVPATSATAPSTTGGNKRGADDDDLPEAKRPKPTSDGDEAAAAPTS